MRAFATALVTVGMLAWGGQAAAQTFAGFGAHAGVSLPTGSYANTANTGFSGGLDLTVPIAAVAPALSWYTSLDFAGHSVDTDAIADAEGGYLHIPVMTGLQFQVPALGMIRPFLNGQVGAVFSRGPDVGGTSASMDTNFGFALGGGLQVTDNIYAGAKWFSVSDVEFVDQSRQVQYVDIYLGFGVR